MAKQLHTKRLKRPRKFTGKFSFKLVLYVIEGVTTSRVYQDYHHQLLTETNYPQFNKAVQMQGTRTCYYKAEKSKTQSNCHMSALFLVTAAEATQEENTTCFVARAIPKFLGACFHT